MFFSSCTDAVFDVTDCVVAHNNNAHTVYGNAAHRTLIVCGSYVNDVNKMSWRAMATDNAPNIDAARNRYPYCIVWTPLPIIT